MGLLRLCEFLLMTMSEMPTHTGLDSVMSGLSQIWTQSCLDSVRSGLSKVWTPILLDEEMSITCNTFL